jgi:hypothetical protein
VNSLWMWFLPLVKDSRLATCGAVCGQNNSSQCPSEWFEAGERHPVGERSLEGLYDRNSIPVLV